MKKLITMQEVKGWCLAQCNRRYAVGLITFGFTWYHKHSQLPKDCAFLTGNKMTEKDPIYVSFSTIQQSCILCTGISLLWQKVWYRFKTFGMLHHADEPLEHNNPEDLNIQQPHCKKLKSHKAQHSPDTRQWLPNVWVYMKCSTFFYTQPG